MDKDLFIFQKNALSGLISEPLCEEYRDEWRRCGDNRKKLISLAMRQQAIPYFASACYRGLGVSKNYLLTEFKDLVNGYTLHDVEGVQGFTYGMYVDYDYDNDLEVSCDVSHIMWTVGANLVIPTTRCPTIYLSNRSNVHLVGEGFNTVNIKLFDKSKITIEDLDEESEVVVYKYSDDAKVELGKFCLGSVKTFNKELRL